jgi:hypothetical protein
LQGNLPGDNPSFIETREELNQTVNKLPAPAIPRALSTLAVVDALLGKKEIAVAEAKRAIQVVLISKDAEDGPSILLNLAVVYAWTGELDWAFDTLSAASRRQNQSVSLRNVSGNSQRKQFPRGSPELSCSRSSFAELF